MNSAQFISNAHQHSKSKVCSNCKEHKSFSEYYPHSTCKDGFDYRCKSCQKEYNDNKCSFKKWFIQKKVQAKVKGKEFTIEPEDIPGVKIRETITIDRIGRKYKSWEAVEYPKVCPVFRIELDWGMNGHQPNSPSLDRIDSTKGYIKGNVMLMSHQANSMKSNATPEELNQFSRYHLFGETA
jgi:hypothetical protein